VGLCPSAQRKGSLAMRGPSETMLEAHLALRPSSARAMTALFEASALWDGMPERAALAVDESSTSPCPATRYRVLFEVFGVSSSFHRLDSPRLAAGRRRRRGRLTALGDFRDLERFSRAHGRAMRPSLTRGAP